MSALSTGGLGALPVCSWCVQGVGLPSATRGCVALGKLLDSSESVSSSLKWG